MALAFRVNAGRAAAFCLGLCFAAAADAANAREWSGYISFEPRYFPDRPLLDRQSGAHVSPSAVAAPELHWRWRDGNASVTVAPFLRLDRDDDHRSHADVREAFWETVGDRWAWKVGIGRVFWGVTESRHLVDIVNQTDLVEDFDEEDKLGQPMIRAERWGEAGTWSFYLLPGFRERTFPDRSARLSGVVPVDTGAAVYESGAGRRRTDAAVRWYRPAGRWDIGVSAFYGTGREPRLVPASKPGRGAVLVPYYDLIGQLGLDLQYTRGSWLWKLEAIGRRGRHQDFGAAVGGFEYTLYGVAGTPLDVGLLGEYLYDGRGRQAPPTLYDHDWFGGVRLSFNDVAGTSVLGGAIVDGDTVIGILEGERRLGSVWKLEIEVRWFAGAATADPVAGVFRRDSYATLRLARYL